MGRDHIGFRVEPSISGELLADRVARGWVPHANLPIPTS
jgi:hypothetical protein